MPVWHLLRREKKVCAVASMVASRLVEPLCLVGQWSDRCDPAVTPAIKRLKGYKINTKRDHVFYPVLFHSSKL